MDIMHRTEAQLVHDHLDGDEKAFEILVRRWIRPVYNFVRTMIRDTREAEDITQEVFVKVWKNLKRYREGESFKAWLFSVARNTVIDHLRKKKDLSFSDLGKDGDETSIENTFADTGPLPDEVFANAEDAAKLKEAVAGLSAMHKEVLFLYYTEGMTFAEIGSALDAPLHTVKSRHRRALEVLRRRLKGEDLNR